MVRKVDTLAGRTCAVDEAVAFFSTEDAAPQILSADRRRRSGRRHGRASRRAAVACGKRRMDEETLFDRISDRSL